MSLRVVDMRGPTGYGGMLLVDGARVRLVQCPSGEVITDDVLGSPEEAQQHAYVFGAAVASDGDVDDLVAQLEAFL